MRDFSSCAVHLTSFFSPTLLIIYQDINNLQPETVTRISIDVQRFIEHPSSSGMQFIIDCPNNNMRRTTNEISAPLFVFTMVVNDHCPFPLSLLPLQIELLEYKIRLSNTLFRCRPPFLWNLPQSRGWRTLPSYAALVDTR